MKKTATRILSAILAAMLLASCSSAPADDSADTTAPADTTTAETTETTPAETEPQLEIPDKTYDGYDFRIHIADDYKMYVFADEQTGESVNDATYDANMAVMERLKIKMSTVPMSKWTATEEIRSLIMAGDNSFDINYSHDCRAGNLSIEGMLANLREIPYLDFDKPWWPEFTTDSLTVNGKMYLISNASSWHGFWATRTLFFNQKLVADYKLESPYELVYSGEWTLDKMIKITSDIYEDVNGDGKRDYGDIYGFGMATPYALSESLGMEAYGKSEDGTKLVMNVYNDENVNMIDKMVNWLCSGNVGTQYVPTAAARYSEDSSHVWFANGKCVFAFGAIGHLLGALMDTETEYGIIPMPKVTEDQEDYVGACCEAPGIIPHNAPDMERTGAIVETMAYEGYKKVTPKYYDYALKGRYATDPDSCAMIDLLFSNRVLSFSYIYNSNIQQAVASVLAQGGNFASWYESNRPSAETRMEELNAFFAGK